MSIENVEANVIYLLTRITDMYMTTEYRNNLNINGTGGIPKFPEITSEIKKRDMLSIYNRFRAQISDNLVRDLSMIYKLDTIDNEEFFISNFVAPIYNSQMNDTVKYYRETEQLKVAQSMDAQLESNYEERRKMEATERNKKLFVMSGGNPEDFDAMVSMNKQAAKDVEEYISTRKFIDNPLVPRKINHEKKLSFNQFIDTYKNNNRKDGKQMITDTLNMRKFITLYNAKEVYNHSVEGPGSVTEPEIS